LDYIKPAEAVENFTAVGAAKSKLTPGHMLIRGFLSGALLAISTSLAITATIQTGVPLVGALVFPVGFVIIVLLGLELLTGNFALLPVAWLDGKTSMGKLLSNFAWVFIGNLLGSVVYAALLYFSTPPAALSEKLVAIAQAKTTGYAAAGAHGMLACFVKAILCNWMVTLGVVMAMISTSTLGKIAAAWLPIFIFFAHGYEHLIVNLFLIPAGMMFGAKVTMSDWLIWNMLPVAIGNFVGGCVLTGLAFYLTYRKPAAVVVAPIAAPIVEPRTAPAGALSASGAAS
jgi:formate/nitrite transporter